MQTFARLYDVRVKKEEAKFNYIAGSLYQVLGYYMFIDSSAEPLAHVTWLGELGKGSAKILVLC